MRSGNVATELRDASLRAVGVETFENSYEKVQGRGEHCVSTSVNTPLFSAATCVSGTTMQQSAPGVGWNPEFKNASEIDIRSALSRINSHFVVVVVVVADLKKNEKKNPDR